ncbi:LysM peptidoglycan-binding domain-containing protein [Facklamia sp. DSM 111018]|uniref:LysM peptidoglycan-binding domain-containing protein n=1 Tax=Facklamia lactis TaxID=2749967 RepID=A0ABS0LQY3_9LACT|nr:LysM domain-containing protein [Facklamia lactis]MBG9986570.1 LysM peptidoglycan-binding domain-containing protein [Facklamia lactis]
MNLKRKVCFGSILLLLSPAALVSAQEWNARTIDQVASEIMVNEQNQVSYLVKEGDTLGVISEAMSIDLEYLAEINQIENIDLIFPGTLLSAQLDEYDRPEKLTVEAPDGQIVEFDVPVDLSPVEDIETIGGDGIVSQPSNEEVLEETVEAEFVSNVAPAEDFLSVESSEVVEEEGVDTPIIETTVAEEVAVEEVSETTVGEPVEEEVIETTATEVMEEVAETTVEEPVVEEVIETTAAEIIEEAPETTVEEPVVEEVIETTAAEIIEEVPETTVEEPVVEEEVIETTVTEVVEEEIPETTVEEVVASDPQGLQPHAAAYRDQIVSQYGVTAYGLRPGDSGDHGSGLAVDFMVPESSATGDAIANDAISSMGANNISYVIWKQQIYGDWTNGWEGMEDRGGVTANHYDHVHVSFNP